MAGQQGPTMIPVPDPTQLTTEAVDRAKADLKELYDVKLGSLEALMKEKFAGVDDTLAAARDMAKLQNESNTTAISKAEASTAKQLTGLHEKIEDLKSTVSRLSERNWAAVGGAVGGYIIGAVGIVALIVSILQK